MSEQRLKDFAEVAERRVPVPDLADLTSRGRDLRRLRRVAAVGALALAVVAGGVLSTVTGDDRSEPPAVDRRTPPSAEELSTRALEDWTLVAGREYVVRPWELTSRDDVEVRFRVPGPQWSWRSDLATMSVGDSAPAATVPRRKYAGVGVMAADRVSASTCDATSGSWTRLDDSPVRAAEQIAAAPGVRLVESVRADTRFGHSGAHVRIEVPRLCPAYRDVILWGVTGMDNGGQPGLATVFYPGQTLDVWVLDVAGLRVVVWSELSPGLPATYQSQALALLDSITLRVAPH